MNIEQALSLIGPAGPLLHDPEHAQTEHPQTAHPQIWADLGCGAGLFTTALSRILHTGSTVYGIDTHPTLKPDPPATMTIKADFIADDLPLHDLDGILMANSLHYVKDKRKFLEKIAIYMRPRAPFLIVEYDTDVVVSTWVPYPLSFGSLTKLFTAFGYPQIQKLGQRASVYGRSNIYAAIIK